MQTRLKSFCLFIGYKTICAFGNIIKDMFLVYFSCVIGIFFIQQVGDPISLMSEEKKPATAVFTNSPDF